MLLLLSTKVIWNSLLKRSIRCEGDNDNDLEEDPFTTIGTKTVASSLYSLITATRTTTAKWYNDDPYETFGINTTLPRNSQILTAAPTQEKLLWYDPHFPKDQSTFQEAKIPIDMPTIWWHLFQQLPSWQWTTTMVAGCRWHSFWNIYLHPRHLPALSFPLLFPFSHNLPHHHLYSWDGRWWLSWRWHA